MAFIDAFRPQPAWPDPSKFLGYGLRSRRRSETAHIFRPEIKAQRFAWRPFRSAMAGQCRDYPNPKGSEGQRGGHGLSCSHHIASELALREASDQAEQVGLSYARENEKNWRSLSAKNSLILPIQLILCDNRFSLIHKKRQIQLRALKREIRAHKKRTLPQGGLWLRTPFRMTISPAFRSSGQLLLPDSSRGSTTSP